MRPTPVGPGVPQPTLGVPCAGWAPRAISGGKGHQPNQLRAKGSWVAEVCCPGGPQPATWRYGDAVAAGGRGDRGRA